MTPNPRQSNRLLRWILLWTGVTFLPSWLPVIRGTMEGSPYQWGSGYFGHAYGGSGLTPGSWILVAELALGLVLLTLGWRGARPPFAPLLVGWHTLITANSTFNAVRSPEDYRFQGDSLGIDVSLAWAGPLVFGTFLFLSLLWAAKHRGTAPAPAAAWTGANTAWTVVLLLLLPVQLLLLRSGEQHGMGDKIGVIVTIAQWLLVPMAVKARQG